VPAAAAHSERVGAHIRAELHAAGGVLDFARFMELALYAPGLGYYSTGAARFDAKGDFTTAAESGPLFARCLARQCAQILQQVAGGGILELGAGSGALARVLLDELRALGTAPAWYHILEPSAALQARQRARLPAARYPEVRWLQALPQQGVQGVILAVEVADALPVHRVRHDGHAWRELCVGDGAEGFAWRELEATGRLAATLGKRFAGHGPFAPGYLTECSLLLAPWVDSLAAVLARGALLCIDYGYTRAEYLHPQRGMGTLLCHYRHHVHDAPLHLVGLQDITASVDFTLLAEAAAHGGLELYGYTRQADFLLNCGLAEFYTATAGGAPPTPAGAQEARRLLLPGEMGERFQVMAMGRGLKAPLCGFGTQDLRHRLHQGRMAEA